MYYLNNKTLGDRVAHERWNPEINESMPVVKKHTGYHRMRINIDEKIIKSYKANPGTIPCLVADMLIKRGMSNGERICLRCYKIIPDGEFARCEPCRRAQYRAYLKARSKYELNRKMKLLKMRA